MSILTDSHSLKSYTSEIERLTHLFFPNQGEDDGNPAISLVAPNGALHGTPADDWLTGGTEDNLIAGWDGNDHLFGNGGNDQSGWRIR